MLTRRYSVTCAERISGKANTAATHRSVSVSSAVSVPATLSLTGVHTLGSDARQMIWTVGFQKTFRSTGGRSAIVALEAGAARTTALVHALGERTTWAGLARVLRPRRFS